MSVCLCVRACGGGEGGLWHRGRAARPQHGLGGAADTCDNWAAPAFTCGALPALGTTCVLASLTFPEVRCVGPCDVMCCDVM